MRQRYGRRQRRVRGHSGRARDRVAAGRAQRARRRHRGAARRLHHRRLRLLQLHAQRLHPGPRARLVLRLGTPHSSLLCHHSLPVSRQYTLLASTVAVLAVPLVALQLDLEPVVPTARAVRRRARHGGAGGAGLGALLAVVGRAAPPRAHGHHGLALVFGRVRGEFDGHETNAHAVRRAVTMRLPAPAAGALCPAPRPTPSRYCIYYCARMQLCNFFNINYLLDS